MSTISLRPILRPSTLPSLPLTTTASRATAPTNRTSNTTTTYVCQTCRHARLLRRPKRPYTFTQLVTLSDGSAFTMRTTSPSPVYRSTRDTRNAPLWNPSSKELLNVEDDEAGRLAGFRARFGKGYDAQRGTGVGDAETLGGGGGQQEGTIVVGGEQVDARSPFFKQATETKYEKGGRSSQVVVDEAEYYDFEEDDANLLAMISSYGKEITAPKAAPTPTPTTKKGKK